jgi:hypothetical protein
MLSTGPPATKPTSSRNGRCGQDCAELAAALCASAGLAVAPTRAKPRHNRNKNDDDRKFDKHNMRLLQ